MSKNFSAPLVRTARLLDLVPYLNSHQGISLKELAENFDVTPAQMSSDLTTLWMCGLPGYTPLELMDLDFDSGYVTISNATTLSKPRTISFEEGIALIMGLDLLKSSIPDDRSDLTLQIQSLKERLINLAGLPVNISVTSPVNAGVASTISEAFQKNAPLKITYHSLYRDEITMRTISPRESYEDEGHRYLSAYCHLANASREFRLDRILQAELSSSPHSNQPPSQESAKVEFEISIEKPNRQLRERFDLPDTPQGAVIKLHSYSQQWVERSILASGESVKVVSPNQLRVAISAKAQRILERYQQD